MLTSPSRVGTLLPKNWPRRVRSAVVHAISMSNVVFTVTRSHGENHFNARVRIQAENDRLRREVALLAEELRIKDARMGRAAPAALPADGTADDPRAPGRAWLVARANCTTTARVGSHDDGTPDSQEHSPPGSLRRVTYVQLA